MVNLYCCRLSNNERDKIYVIEFEQTWYYIKALWVERLGYFHNMMSCHVFRDWICRFRIEIMITMT